MDLLPILNNKVVVLWSGGLDSTGLIKIILDNYKGVVFPIFLKHGQRNEEYEFNSIQYYSEKFKENFSSRFNDPFVASTDIPAIEFKEKNYKSRILLRNSDLINNAVRFAVENNIHSILIATFNYDMADGQQKFFDAKEKEIEIATGKNIKIISPFFFDSFPCTTKTQVIDYLKKNKFEYSFTRSCYESTEKPCGECEACKNLEKALTESKFDF